MPNEKMTPTPGDWRADRDPGTDPEWAVVGPDGHDLAVVQARRATGETEANARLLAAAPVLLAAVEKAALLIRGLMVPTGPADLVSTAVGLASGGYVLRLLDEALALARETT